MFRNTWLPIAADSPYSVHNLPYGVFSVGDGPRRVGVRIGDHVLDLAALAAADALDAAEALSTKHLNAFMALGPAVWRSTRAWLTGKLTDPVHRDQVLPHLLPLAGVRLHLPFEVADYVDFYASEHHAANLGKLFRPGSDPLTPNWKHLPIGYHGRAGTVVVSGTPITRPRGQRRPNAETPPVYGPSARLDIEAEIGFVVGVPTEPGAPMPISQFAEHVFGVVVVNDWSARDIQAWEYVPLGPFLGKSFAATVSAWVVPLEALAAARVSGPVQDPEPLPYLRVDEPWGLDLRLEVEWNGVVVSRPPFGQMYWSAAQQLAHLTANGASLRTGDFFASGTVPGPGRDQVGSFIELSWNGTEPVTFADGSARTFLADGDRVTIRATAPAADGGRIGFGEVTGIIQPAGPEAVTSQGL
ncbi:MULTISPECIES: fumarylacetoacetase [unclassified Crossiella]|uniref:fumarylacetoacetase n=1 Tax=unclassified Crossiella TaxID=2620835 RepID=UPI0020005468|nr:MULTISPECIES: fumarylacetoacetase [unclassified Crossiella]MCK2244623.1 fumarylacetoacetase [Crossiella sp. S99.2]MCK2258390.1 fumarylacetoacetase [Crossiella sp. S99.1]